MDTLCSIVSSWCTVDNGQYTTEELLAWIEELNCNATVEINRITLNECYPWVYDDKEGCIRNQARTFFAITGSQWQIADHEITSQPVMIQKDIGLLGVICKKFRGVMHFLMQAKIEPGNINKVQISPTLQATKSNFTQKHGGKKPPYLDFFLNASRYEVIVDQLQSEQSSRFIGKRNRNIVICVESPVPQLPSYRWMTLGQIKWLMRKNNLVNMDTRTVLSCIPYSRLNLQPDGLVPLSKKFSNQKLFRSIWPGANENFLPQVYHCINNYKMLSCAERKLVPLHQLPNWTMHDDEIVCKERCPFKVIFCDIAIEGREVKRWTQPLFEATESATFGLICCEDNGMLRFLVKIMPEIGCFDQVELGPTVQSEGLTRDQNECVITQFFIEKMNRREGILFDHMLSEEGGRFFHEQNRNILIMVKREELPVLPEGYFLLDYRTLNELGQINNILNIQLRNLLSLLEA